MNSACYNDMSLDFQYYNILFFKMILYLIYPDNNNEGFNLSIDLYSAKHDELKEKDYKIWLKMHEMKNNYINKHGTNNMSFLEEDSLLIGLKRTKKWKTLEKQLISVNKSIVELYSEYIENECTNCELKKDKIIALKKKFGWQAHTGHIAKVAKCSRGYVREFDIDRNGNVEMKPQRKKLSSIIRKKVLKRDNSSCVMCGAVENLQIHHIHSVAYSTLKDKNNIKNLATLCKKCHYLAHDGNYWGIEAYSNVKGGFWEWIKDSERIKMEHILKNIHGVGPVLINRTYEKFGSLDNLKRSNLDNLMKIKGLNETLAKRIKSRLA